MIKEAIAVDTGMMTMDQNIDLGAADNAPKVRLPKHLDLLYLFFHILVMITCILGTVKYWALLMGMTHGGGLRFDIAPNHWKIAASVLALLLPLTALGVWFRNGFGLWGWVLVTLIQIAMHVFLPHLYGYNILNLISAVSIFSVFMFFRWAYYVREKRQQILEQDG